MRRFALLSISCSFLISSWAQIAISNDGSPVDPTAMLEVKSTEKGMLVPRMTTVQRNNIVSPANGLLVYDTDTQSFWYKHSSGWINLLTALSNVWSTSGINIYNANTGGIGIGTSTPVAKLDVNTVGGNPLRINGGNGLYVSLFENGLYRGYLGSFAGASEDVDIGTGSGNTSGKLHLTIQANPKLTIDNTGRVGIGTIAPSTLALLDVAGKIRTSDLSGDGLQQVQVDNNGILNGAPVVGFEAKVTNLSGISISAGTENEVNFTATEFNDGGAFNISTDRFTAPSSGLYHFDIRFNWLQFSSNGTIDVRIRKNGSTLAGTSIDPGNTVLNTFDSKYSFNLKLAAGDYLQVFITQNSSGNQAYRQAIFSGFKVY